MHSTLFKSALRIIFFLGVIGSLSAQQKDATADEGWVSLFNGQDLQGWKVGDNAATFSVVNGTIKVNGEVAHLFYEGEVEGHNFENFEFKAQVMTKSKANSGIYFHTRYQEGGWPAHGYEVQVNNSHTDWRRTGSLYAVQDVIENYVQDDTWYTEHIRVEGNRIIIKINDTIVVDYTEPDQPKRDEGSKQKVLGTGTFALQGHDPGSVVFYKDIMVRVLP